MVETDAPYMAPTPFRGKRCDSRYVYRMAGPSRTSRASPARKWRKPPRQPGRNCSASPTGRPKPSQGRWFYEGRHHHLRLLRQPVHQHDQPLRLPLRLLHPGPGCLRPGGACGSRRSPRRRPSWKRSWPMTSPPTPRLSFCGYGEPTCRADDLFWICDQLHAAGRARPACPHPAEHQRPRQPHQPPGHHPGAGGAAGRGVCLPQRVGPGGVPPPHPPPRRRGEKGWQAMLDFVGGRPSLCPR